MKLWCGRDWCRCRTNSSAPRCCLLRRRAVVGAQIRAARRTHPRQGSVPVDVHSRTPSQAVLVLLEAALRRRRCWPPLGDASRRSTCIRGDNLTPAVRIDRTSSRLEERHLTKWLSRPAPRGPAHRSYLGVGQVGSFSASSQDLHRFINHPSYSDPTMGTYTAFPVYSGVATP